MSILVKIFSVFTKIGHNIFTSTAAKQYAAQCAAAFYRRNDKKISKKVLQITAK